MNGQQKKRAAEFKVKLTERNDWLARAIVVIHSHQTSDEQYLRETVYHNQVGFNAIDAEIMSSFADQINAGRYLSPKQLAVARRIMPKYAGQLVKIAEAKAAAKVDPFETRRFLHRKWAAQVADV